MNPLERLAIRGGALLLAVVWASGCHRRTPTGDDGSSAPGASAHQVLTSVQPSTLASVYDLAVPLTDQDGRARELDAFRGHPVVISMFYSSCPYACPTLISHIQQLERSLSDLERADVRVVLVSFDPERDTPAKLKVLAQERHADIERWILARTSDDKVRELAAVLGLKYKRLPDGGFNHSSVITVLDRNGFVRARSDGLGSRVDDALKVAVDAVARK